MRIEIEVSAASLVALFVISVLVISVLHVFGVIYLPVYTAAARVESAVHAFQPIR